MCVARCSHCIGLSLVPLAVVCMLANTLLLFPNLQIRYLAERHVTREAALCTGFWANGFLVLVAARGYVSSAQKTNSCSFRMEMMCQIAYSSVAMAAAGFSALVSGAGLSNGPHCLHNSTGCPEWGRVPVCNLASRLYESKLCASACMEPYGVVLWNTVLFFILLAASGLQVFLCALQTLNAFLGMIFGPGFRNNKVAPAPIEVVI
ncbi:transmembrane 4 L6 family member 1 [Chanos chanos]|uniref:Transmembrane 4 L6 family member 1 n=1 Tax=Chanos chanos TaxID=29144 RepID=A0A6J2VLJ3_CHACN|nr:transmembrane 4 L6 family member 1-like [Chanos chanos]